MRKALWKKCLIIYNQKQVIQWFTNQNLTVKLCRNFTHFGWQSTSVFERDLFDSATIDTDVLPRLAVIRVQYRNETIVRGEKSFTFVYTRRFLNEFDVLAFIQWLAI